MATKTIPSLNLISAVATDTMFPVDDGTQSYRATGAQLKAFILANGNITLPMLSDSIFTGLTAVSAADDDYFALVDTSDSNKTKKSLVGTFARNQYRSVTLPDSVLSSTDRTVYITGTTGTLTLPAIGTAPGKRYRLIHLGTNFVAYNLATTGGATINGIASGSYGLYTNGEMVEVEDPGTGTDWPIVGRHTNTVPLNSGALTITGTTTNPTKGTITLDEYWWHREGAFAVCTYALRQTVAGSSGSGDYLYAFPTGMSADTNKVTAFSTVSVGGIVQPTNSLGYAQLYSTTGPTVGSGSVVLHNSTNFRLLNGQNSIMAGSSQFALGGTTITKNANFRYRVSNWQP